VLAGVVRRVAAYRPGLPTDPATTMGALVSRAQHERVLHYIELGKREGARLLCGGTVPDDPLLARGYFVDPTVFADVTQDMRIAREEIFGPVLSVLPWTDEPRMLAEVNSVPVGLTCAIFTNDVSIAHRTALAVEAGYVWVNEVGRHFLGAPFGGVKQSGFGREECLEEMLGFTAEKNIHIRLRHNADG
jgi:betaine-aldehyde dehydrogenase